jgi:ribosome-associated protein
MFACNCSMAYILVLSVSDNSMNGCPIAVLAIKGGKELLFLTKLVQPALDTREEPYFSIKRDRLLEPLSVLKSREKKSSSRLTRNSKIFKTIIRAIQDKKGENIVSLDLRKIAEASADFFIVAEASNTTQVKAICDFVEDQVKKDCDELPYKHEGRQAAQWVLIDYVNIVVHVMHPETRRFYKLEEMWSDAESREHDL